MKIPVWSAGLSFLLCGCFQDSAPQHSGVLPLDYQTTFHTVRSCRLVVGHMNNYMKVLTNSLGSDSYTTANYPLPEGSVVLAEHYGGDPSCGSPSGYYLMAKEKPGYFSSGGDWRWQELDSGQRIIHDGRLQQCASCHAACGTSDYLCSPP